ncbi:MAG: TlpA disulfide reductase family protein [Nitrospira sp.]|nr:TlpA disulfide reductase family protein [Nitrospira sp.]MDE0405033.1 TlpA disulfide reductase family protein [Nitrospira sp.]
MNKTGAHSWKQVVICSLALWCVASGTACDSGYSDERREQPSVKSVAVRRVPPDMGSQAPDFQLIDLQGNWQALPDYRGKVVLLNFWATWCGPCRVEMPSMERVYQDLKDEGFAILAISSDPQGSIVTRPFVSAQGLTFPILHDSDYQVSGSYGVRTLPMSFLIDRNGTLNQRVFGARDWNSAEARELIRGLLRES